jgi:hypothetical protein
MWSRCSAIMSVVVVSLTFLAGEVEAEPAFCGALRADLAAASGATSGGSGNSLASAQAQARGAGCYGVFRFFRGAPSPACGAIMARVNRLQRAAAPRSFGLFSIFSAGPDQRRANLKQQLAQAGCASSLASGGTLRTLCVRKCDGYYFPINSAATRKRLVVDQRVCESMYPPGQASLYTQRYSGQAEGDMTSLQGEVYAKQPFAFLYRFNYDSGCASSLGQKTMAGALVSAEIPVQTKPAAFSPAQHWSAPPTADETDFSDLRSVRIVGPVSYYTLPDPVAPAAQATPPVRAPGSVGVVAIAARIARE